nr:hypothetical protein [Aquibacillus saliphilus]
MFFARISKITGNVSLIGEKVENPPKDARSLGAMESNQRHVSFRMKKRGMHWSEAGGEDGKDYPGHFKWDVTQCVS